MSDRRREEEADGGPVPVGAFALRFGPEPEFLGVAYCQAAGARGVNVSSWTMTSSGEGVLLSRVVESVGARMAEIPDGWRTTRLEVVVDPGGCVAWALLEWRRMPEPGRPSAN